MYNIYIQYIWILRLILKRESCSCDSGDRYSDNSSRRSKSIGQCWKIVCYGQPAARVKQQQWVFDQSAGLAGFWKFVKQPKTVAKDYFFMLSHQNLRWSNFYICFVRTRNNMQSVTSLSLPLIVEHTVFSLCTGMRIRIRIRSDPFDFWPAGSGSGSYL